MKELRTILLAVSLASLTCITAQAQDYSIIGHVNDSNSEAMAGVNVSLQGLAVGSISDRDGRFEIRRVAAGSYVLICSFIGFETVSMNISVPLAEPVLCELKPAILGGGEIVVTASRRPQLASDVPASINVISADYLAERRVESLDVAIRNTPGVQLQGNQVNIRGSSGFAYNVGSRVLLLVDGMSLLSPDTDGIPFDSFPIDRIRQIEILKGPGSALYGSGALGGVINLISREAPDEPETNIRSSVGYYEPFRYGLWTSQWPASENGRLNYSFAASHARKLSSRVGAWVSVSGIIDEGFLSENRSRVLNAYGKVTADVSKSTTIDVLTGLLTRRRDNFLFWNGLSDALNPGNLAISRSEESTGSSDNLTSTFSLLPQVRTVLASSGVLTSRARFYALMIRPIDDNGKPKPLSVGTLGFRVGAESQYSRFVSFGQITGGITFDANITRSSFFVSETGAETGRQPEAAAYVQVESKLAERLNAVGGLRTDVFWISTIERVASLSPKLGVSYRLDDRTSLRASWGKGFRVPSIAERFTDDQGYFPVFRNLDLRPETSVSYEVGVRSDQQDDRLHVDVSAFWFELDNLIEPRFVQQIEPDKPRLLGFQFVNLDRGRVAGIELDTRVQPWAKLSARFGYTYLDSKDRKTGLPLAYRPKHLIVAGASFADKSATAGIDFRYATTPETIDSDFARFIPDADVLVNTIVTDAHVSYTMRRITATFIVNNVFDYYYLDRPALLAAPREFVVQLSATL